MKGRLPVRHRRIVSSLGVAALAICLPPELEAKPSNADKARDSALLSFVTIPDKVLPKHVRLRKDAHSDAILPMAQNPAIVTDRRRIDFIAKFFGVKEQAELKSIAVGVAAIYEDDFTEREIGIWGIYYSDQKSADGRFNKLLTRSKKSKVNGRVFSTYSARQIAAIHLERLNRERSRFQGAAEVLGNEKVRPSEVTRALPTSHALRRNCVGHEVLQAANRVVGSVLLGSALIANEVSAKS
jgi:hypothetical protein